MEARRLTLGALALAVGVLACTSSRSRLVTAPSLAQRCPKGPHCVAGQIEDRYATPLPVVRCSVRLASGQLVETLSDDEGMFLIDGLTEPPREILFLKDGFNRELAGLPQVVAGLAVRLYVTLQRSDLDNCSCDTMDIFWGQPACPDELCDEARLPEAPP